MRDLSLYGNHGKLHGFAYPSTVASGWNPGRTGVGLNFDGADDYVDCGNDSSINFGGGDFTISVWSQYNTSGTRSCIVDKSELTSASGGYSLEVNNSDNIQFTYFDGTVPPPELFGSSNVSDKKWHCIQVIWKADNSERKLIVDGVVEDSTSTQSNTGIDSAFNLLIGARGSHGDFNFNGSIADPRIHNRALTAKEVQDYYINPWQVYLDEEDM